MYEAAALNKDVSEKYVRSGKFWNAEKRRVEGQN